jgi:hypothetical protein
MKSRLSDSRVLALVMFTAGLWGLAGTAVLAQGASAATSPSAADQAAWRQELTAWRAQRASEVSAPDGWLTLVGLEWLQPGFNSFGAATDNKIRHLITSAF